MIVENVSSIKHIVGPARQKKDDADAVPNICKKIYNLLNLLIKYKPESYTWATLNLSVPVAFF